MVVRSETPSHNDLGGTHDESNGGGDPTVLLVHVDPLVAHQSDEEGDDGDDHNSDGMRNVLVGDNSKRLGSSDGVDRGPSDTGDAERSESEGLRQRGVLPEL